MVWVANTPSGTASRIDPDTNAVLATVKVGATPSDGAIAADGTVWIPNLGAGTVTLVDGSTNRVRGRVRTGRGPFVISEAFGSMWVPSFNGADVRRFRP